MKNRDKGKTSLVDFLRSIKFSTRAEKQQTNECNTHFAALDPHARQASVKTNEDNSLVRSAN